MKRGFLILLAGLAAGLGGHVAYFSWQTRELAPASGDSLAWMRHELRLTDAQYARIVSLHQENGHRLATLSLEVQRLRDEYNGFEQRRLTADQVDFLAFAKFVETQRQVNRTCDESAKSLVRETLSILDGKQRTQLISLLTASGGERLLR